MLPRIYLIRHGETEWSRAGKHTSRTEVSLTPQGEADAREMGRRLRSVSFARILTSPRLRARQSCTEAGFAQHAQVDPELAEWDYGDLEGLRTAEILLERPTWNIFRDGCPGGESPLQIASRADGVIERLRAMEGNIALFSHAHFLRVLGARWAGLPFAAAGKLVLDTASLSTLSYEHDRPGEPAIVLWNERIR